MRNPTDMLRAVLAGLLGGAAGVAVFTCFAKYGYVPWRRTALLAGRIPDGQELVGWLMVAGMAIGLAGLYALWFDRLLGGNAFVRGTKFGLISWVWCVVLVRMAFEYAPGRLPIARPMAWALAALGVFLVFGWVTGVVYGAGRRYDEYLFGLGYGVSDSHVRS